MKCSRFTVRVLLAALPMLATGCATSPFTGKPENEDTINAEFATYQQRVTNTIAKLQTDAQNATNTVNPTSGSCRLAQLG